MEPQKNYLNDLKSYSPTKKEDDKDIKKQKLGKTKSADETHSTSVNLIQNKPSDPTENMHSSQLPPEKPPLTKGLRIPSMMKRLSMEKLSPPPAGVKAFSYLSPSTSPHRDIDDEKKIVYAEVICTKNPDRKREQENVNDYSSKNRIGDELFYKPNIDEPDFKYKPYTNGVSSNHKKYNLFEDDFEVNPHKQTAAERFASKYRTATSYSFDNQRAYMDDDTDDRIKPNIRDLPPEKPPINSWEMGGRGQADGKEYYPEFNELSNRREELYSRIKSRIQSTTRDVVDEAPRAMNVTYKSPNVTTSQVRRNLYQNFLDESDKLKQQAPVQDHLHTNGKSHKVHTETRKEIRTHQYYDDRNIVEPSGHIDRYRIQSSPLKEPSPKREITSISFSDVKGTAIQDNKNEKIEEKSHKTFTNSLGRKKKNTNKDATISW